MLDITVRNVNEAYAEGLWKMKTMGELADSRNGKVMRIPGPVATTYTNPCERMLLDPKRDANPFFHIFEGIWMLAGRRDVKFLKQFNSTIDQFSDDGHTLRGAYGARWRDHFNDDDPIDQLTWVINHLKRDPTSRRAVLQMFDPVYDQRESKDIPCNTAVYFDIVEGALNMTVTCRSNDMIWGAYGANAVHMSMLQEFVAGALGVLVGQYVQFSNNFHIYERHFHLLEYAPEPPDQYYDVRVPIVWDSHNWENELIALERWCEEPWHNSGSSPYISKVLAPMLGSWKWYKERDRPGAMACAQNIEDTGVRVACTEWLQRRKWDRHE